jgi:hypothetical protein
MTEKKNGNKKAKKTSGENPVRGGDSLRIRIISGAV